MATAPITPDGENQQQKNPQLTSGLRKIATGVAVGLCIKAIITGIAAACRLLASS